MVSLPSTSGVLRLSVVVALATVALLLTSPALSQQPSEREDGVMPRPSNESASPNLPGWAEPSGPGIRKEDETRSRPRSGVSSRELSGSMQTNQPSLPGDPNQVPVDGGLALLAAAGAGYAVRKLNEDEEDDEDPA